MAANTDIPSQIVVDASAMLAKLLPDEKTLAQIEDYFRLFSRGKISFMAPVLLPFEVANGLRSAVKQKRLAEKTAAKLLDEFLKLDIGYRRIDFASALKLAIKNETSVYDAAYISLAAGEKIPLLSLDQRLMEIVKSVE